MSAKPGRPVTRPSQDDGTLPPVVSSPGFVDLYPYLTEFLRKPRGSGQTATTGTMTLFLECGCFKWCLNDRPHERSTFVSGPTLHLALANAESLLKSGRAKWRTSGYKKAADRQKYFSRA